MLLPNPKYNIINAMLQKENLDTMEVGEQENLEECLRAVGEDRSGRALHPLGSVGSAEEHWARGVLLLRCPLA